MIFDDDIHRVGDVVLLYTKNGVELLRVKSIKMEGLILENDKFIFHADKLIQAGPFYDPELTDEQQWVKAVMEKRFATAGYFEPELEPYDINKHMIHPGILGGRERCACVGLIN